MIEKPKKERRFLKTLGRVGEILIEQVLIKVGSSFIKKIGGKKTLPSILFLLASLSLFAQFPNTGNKQRLGFQTTGDGLTWRGSLSDTASIQPVNNQNAWVILDTINLKFYSFDFTSNVWNLVGGAPGLTMPFDSITFNTAKDGTVGVGEVEYNDTQGSLIQGLKGGLVTNVIGQQLHQRVNNQTGATLAKGTAVYLSGSQGNRITVAKGLAVSDAFSANTFGVVAESIADNASGYIITEGLITGLNTSALTEDSAVYLSPTVAGALTSTKPQAPQHSVYIGVCVKSNAGSGELFVKIRNGQELDELHDVRITSPVDKASLYYKSGLWRDTTAALLTSDTASMLTNYLRTGTAASTYLPLAGGTLTGALNGTSATFTGSITNPKFIINNTAYSSYTTDGLFGGTATPAIYNPLPLSTSGQILFGYKDVGGGQYVPRIGFTANSPNTVTKSSIGLEPNSGDFTINGGASNSEYLRILASNGNASFTQKLTVGASTNYDVLNVHHTAENGFRMSYQSEPTKYFFQIRPVVTLGNVRYIFSQTNANIFYDSILVFNRGNIAINKLNPSYKLDVNGTLGVTGATTLSAPLTVNSSAVFNEGSADSDFRVESVTNTHMVFVDASTNKVGIGTNTPTKELDVNGELRIGTVTATPSTLLGINGSNVVGEVTSVNQSGFMYAAKRLGDSTDASGELIFAHGLSWTPSFVFAQVLYGTNLYINPKSVDATNITLRVYDNDGNAVESTYINAFQWMAIK
tara:strand:- start:2153 stop:4402 length:2250 start_codon:yes stop_codon:yes gene_type:complete